MFSTSCFMDENTKAQQKSAGGSLLTACASAVVGLLLIIYHNHLDLINWAVIAIGLVIAIPALYLLITSTVTSKTHPQRNMLAAFCALVVLAMGLWVVCDNGFFARFIVYVFAVVLILYGVWNFFSVSAFGRKVQIPVWLYLIPALLIVTGLAFLFTSLSVLTGTVVLIMGIALVASAVNIMMSYFNSWRTPKDEVECTEKKQ